MKAGGEGDDRGRDGWMASPARWTWVWASSGSWWWTGRPGVLQSMGSQRVRGDWVTELNWSQFPVLVSCLSAFSPLALGFIWSYQTGPGASEDNPFLVYLDFPPFTPGLSAWPATRAPRPFVFFSYITSSIGLWPRPGSHFLGVCFTLLIRI